MKNRQGPKVLLLDIETAPILGHVWRLFDQNVALNQIVKDWHLLSWSAKWLGDTKDKTMYMDQRNKKDIEDDKALCLGIRKLLNEADIVITHNGKKFDIPRLNARFAKHKIKPSSSFKQIDTCQVAKRHFDFTSNKLEYLTDFLGVEHKKLKHKKFPGHELWTECLKNNSEAWEEMKLYNKYDVLGLEEVYQALIPWDNSINFNLYTDTPINACKCGSTDFKKNGFAYTATSKFQRYECKSCGTETRDKTNLFSKEKRKSLRTRVTG